jgi:hypothetical protein
MPRLISDDYGVGIEVSWPGGSQVVYFARQDPQSLAVRGQDEAQRVQERLLVFGVRKVVPRSVHGNVEDERVAGEMPRESVGVRGRAVPAPDNRSVLDATSEGAAFVIAASGRRSIADLGWTIDEAAATRARLLAFEEDWNAPGMDAYDASEEG